MGDVPKFLDSLREEVLHHKEKRSTFVLRKLTFVIALFGLSSLSNSDITTNWLLYSVPFVSLAFDVYIFAEHYKVGRIGAFNRIFRYASVSERNWERFVHQHRERTAVWASFVLTTIAIVASALVLYGQVEKKPPTAPDIVMSGRFLAIWLILAILLMIGTFIYQRILMNRLPKPHLIKEQSDALLAAPDEKSRDELMIALILNTGVTPQELLSLQVGDLHEKVKNKESGTEQHALCVRESKGCKGRRIPYLDPSIYTAVVQGWQRESVTNASEVFHDIARDLRPLEWNKNRNRPALGSRAKKKAKIDNILINYPIVIDGAIHFVDSGELRRTYARNLFREVENLRTVQKYLGCSNIRDELGYIGPIEEQIKQKQHPPDTE